MKLDVGIEAVSARIKRRCLAGLGAAAIVAVCLFLQGRAESTVIGCPLTHPNGTGALLNFANARAPSREYGDIGIGASPVGYEVDGWFHYREYQIVSSGRTDNVSLNMFLLCEYNDDSEIRVPIPNGYTRCDYVFKFFAEFPFDDNRWTVINQWRSATCQSDPY